LSRTCTSGTRARRGTPSACSHGANGERGPRLNVVATNIAAELAEIDWPQRSGDQAGWQGPDILVLAFQEINALNAVNVVAGGDERTVDAWRTAIHCALNETALPETILAAQARSLSLQATDSCVACQGLSFRPHSAICRCVLDAHAWRHLSDWQPGCRPQ
jgi:hypothetical protein